MQRSKCGDATLGPWCAGRYRSEGTLMSSTCCCYNFDTACGSRSWDYSLYLILAEPYMHVKCMKIKVACKGTFFWFLISMCHEVTDESSQRNGIDIRTRRRSVLSVVWRCDIGTEQNNGSREWLPWWSSAIGGILIKKVRTVTHVGTWPRCVPGKERKGRCTTLEESFILYHI